MIEEFFVLEREFVLIVSWPVKIQKNRLVTLVRVLFETDTPLRRF